MKDANDIILRFDLQPHPEGGHYREMHRSAHSVVSPRHGGARSAFTVAANTWFAARPADAHAFSFVSCVVGPGFEFADFELASREALRAEFGTTPEHVSAIEAFCR